MPKRVKTSAFLYTHDEIEEMLGEIKTIKKYNGILAIKRPYCKEYWKEIIPEKEDKEEVVPFEDKIKAAIAKAEAELEK